MPVTFSHFGRYGVNCLLFTYEVVMNRFLLLLAGCVFLFWGSPAAAESPLPASWSPAIQASTAKLLSAGADAGQVMELTAKMVESGYDDSRIIEVQQLIGESGEEVPLAPLMNKAREGLAKKVPAALLRRAIEQVRNRYREAYRYARGLSKDKPEREALGQLLVNVQTAGLTGPELEGMMAAVQARAGKSGTTGEQQELIRQSLLLAREMSRQGASPDLTAQVVSVLLEKGAGSGELAEVSTSFAMHRNRLQINELARGYLQMLDAEPSMRQFMNGLRQNSATGNGSASQSGEKGSQNTGDSGGGNSAAGEGAGNGQGNSNGQGGQDSGSGQGNGNSGAGSGSGNAGNGNSDNGGNGQGNGGGGR